MVHLNRREHISRLVETPRGSFVYRQSWNNGVIILCSETDGDVARYSTLAKNDQLYAAKYKLCLPTQEELRREIERQKEIFQMEKGGNKET